MKILIIQTAFIGDVILATGMVEKLSSSFPEAEIDMLVRKGNESLLNNNPHLHEVLVWNKKQDKLKNLFKLVKEIRKRRYDKVINIQRFASSGILTAFSAAKETRGFKKNPLSFLFTQKLEHTIVHTDKPVHEIERNHALIKDITDDQPGLPRLYPSPVDVELVRNYSKGKYITVSPASVWFTKQFPSAKWIDFINQLPDDYTVYLLGGPGDKTIADAIIAASEKAIVVKSLCGELSFLSSAALMKDAVMNYVNDSAPLHIASAMNAPVAAVFCSTVPAFGFTPLSDQSFIIETPVALTCRPCGLHGKKACPLGHFNCANNITTAQLLQCLPA